MTLLRWQGGRGGRREVSVLCTVLCTACANEMKSAKVRNIAACVRHSAANVMHSVARVYMVSRTFTQCHARYSAKRVIQCLARGRLRDVRCERA